jgi:hypothetical protein
MVSDSYINRAMVSVWVFGLLVLKNATLGAFQAWLDWKKISSNSGGAFGDASSPILNHPSGRGSHTGSTHLDSDPARPSMHELVGRAIWSDVPCVLYFFIMNIYISYFPNCNSFDSECQQYSTVGSLNQVNRHFVYGIFFCLARYVHTACTLWQNYAHVAPLADLFSKVIILALTMDVLIIMTANMNWTPWQSY